MELGERRKGSATIAIVDDRARDDEWYFSRLQSMVTYSVVAATWQLMSLPQITGRWSGFRQGVIDKARELIDSEEFKLPSWRDPTDHNVDPEEVRQAARDLLTKDAYHFRKTAAVRSRITTDSTFPHSLPVPSICSTIPAPRVHGGTRILFKAAMQSAFCSRNKCLMGITDPSSRRHGGTNCDSGRSMPFQLMAL